MKTIGAMLLLALGAIGLHHALNNPPTVEAASKAVANTEVNLKDAATITRSQATQLSNGLTAPDRQVALPQELADFNRRYPSGEPMCGPSGTCGRRANLNQAAVVRAANH